VTAPGRHDHPLNDRLVRVLGRALARTARIDSYSRPVAPTDADSAVGANAYLIVLEDRPEVRLELHPADTLTQAKAFYPRHNAQAGVRKLGALPEWEVRPNFHFGHFQRGYCWTCNECELDAYVALWVRRIRREEAVPRADWGRYWAWLESDGIACPRDRDEFDRHFTHSQRPNAVPRPGLTLSRRWSLRDVQPYALESEFEEQVRRSFGDALAAFAARRS
jgi:hypothetical protein